MMATKIGFASNDFDFTDPAKTQLHQNEYHNSKQWKRCQNSKRDEGNKLPPILMPFQYVCH